MIKIVMTNGYLRRMSQHKCRTKTDKEDVYETMG